MVQRSSDDAAALQGRVRDFLNKLREVVERLGVDEQGANTRFDPMFEEFSGTLNEFGIVELNISTNRITIGESEVFRSESRTNNLAFDLFRQGIRQLKFLPELESDELYTLVVRFGEFSKVEEIDEDINTMLWRESLPHIEVVAVDIFTEKVFMADPEFMERFTNTIKDVVPGLFSFSEEEELPVVDLDTAAELVSFNVLDQADLDERKLRREYESQRETLRNRYIPTDDRCLLADHLIQQVCALALHAECPLQDSEIRGVLSRIVTVYSDGGRWDKLADAMRTLHLLSEHRGGLEAYRVSRLERIGRVASGRDMLELIAAEVPPDKTNFISWSRWFFMQAQSLEAPQLLELVNGCSNPVGKDLIKSLLRRQNTSSMDAWAERLRDPNGSIVEEVIDVIVESDLGEQAKPLFLDTLQHKAAAVRARSIEVLTPFYDAQVREAVLPLITDPDSRVRLSILSLAQTLRDSSLAPYFIQVAQSDDSYSYGEDELRRLFETIALLGGAKLTDLFESRLSLESSGGVVSQLFKSKKSAIEDTSMRRAAISGLAILGDTKSVNLIKKVHRNAELSLAAHCEVALKTADRVRKNHEQTSEEARGEKAIEDWDAFSGLMGDRMLFLPNDLGLNAERIVAVSKEPSQSPKTENLEESATVESRNDMPRRTEPSPDNLYTAGESVLAMRRLLGQPSVLTGGDYRILDLQLAIVPLAEVTHTVKPTLKKGAAIEKKRAAISNENIDDLLKSYVETEHSQNSESVDEILQGYLGGETDPPPQRETSDQDLESLLMDYAQEDTKGSK